MLKARKNPFTIELLFLDGEEAFIDWYLGDDHTYGSRHYVQEAKRTGDLARIKAMILVDMIGDRDLVIKRETALDRRGSPTPSGRRPGRSATAPPSWPSRSPSRTTTSRSSTRACRRWTSSISSIRRGTRPRTPSTR